MGQSESRKLKRNKKSLVFPKTSPGFMESFPRNNSTEDSKGKVHDGSGGNRNVQSRGVAMSFGFRRRPASAAASASTNQESKKKEEDKSVLPKRPVSYKEPIVEREQDIPKQRFGFRAKKHQETEKMDSNNSSRTSPDQAFGAPRFNSGKGGTYSPESLLPSPIQPQMLKYKLQSTELPQLEPVRVIKSKIQKTIFNTKRKSADSRQQQHEESLTNDDLFLRSSTFTARRPILVKNNNDLAMFTSNNSTENKIGYKRQDDNCNISPGPENVAAPVHISNNATCLPERTRQISWKSDDSNIAKETHTNFCSDSICQPDIQKTFFKLKLDEITKNDNQSELWDNAGEAMALDINQLNHKYNKKPKYNATLNTGTPSLYQASTSTVTTSTQVASPLDLLPTLKTPDSNLLNDELGFVTAAASTSCTGMLLDDEILSPIESLSSSEAEGNTKSSLSKDINEKSPNSTPPSPTNISSMSLVEEKDFLIDDEIADQPGLTFKSTPNKSEDTLHAKMMKNPKKIKGYEASPLSMKNRRLLTKSTGSLDSLSSCESIGSDDFIMDYESVHANEQNDIQRSPSKASEKTSIQDRDSTDSPWLESRDIAFSPLISNFAEPRHLDSLNCNNAYNLNFSPRQTPTLNTDIKDIKKMLLKLKIILNDCDVQNPFRDAIINSDDYFANQTDRLNENVDNTGLFEKELADLRRQVLFLQVQLENKEETVVSLQQQVIDLTVQSPKGDAAEVSEVTRAELRKLCNAATQTKRINAS